MCFKKLISSTPPNLTRSGPGDEFSISYHGNLSGFKESLSL